MPLIPTSRSKVISAGGTKILVAQQGRTADYAAVTSTADAKAAAVSFTEATNRAVVTDGDRYIKRIYRPSSLGFRYNSPGLENATIGESVDRSATEPGAVDASGDVVLLNVQEGLEPWLQTLVGDKDPDVSAIGQNSLRWTFKPANDPLPGLSLEITRGTVCDRAFGVQPNQLAFGMARNELSAFTFSCIGLDYQINTAGNTAATAGTPIPTPAADAAASDQSLGGIADLSDAVTGQALTDITSGRVGRIQVSTTGLSGSTVITVTGTDPNDKSQTETFSFSADGDKTTTGIFKGSVTVSSTAATAGIASIVAKLVRKLGERTIATVAGITTTSFKEAPSRGFAGWAARLLNEQGEILGGSAASFTYNNNFSVPDDLIGEQGGARVTRGSNFRELSAQLTLPFSKENLGSAYDFIENTKGGPVTLELLFKRAGKDDSRLAFKIANSSFDEIPLPGVESPGEISNQINMRLLPDDGQNNIVEIEYDVPVTEAVQLQAYS